MPAQVFTPTVSIHLDRYLPAAAHDLFHALTDSARVTSWMNFPAAIVPGLGGRVTVKFSPTEALDGVVSTWQPDRSFAYTWGDSIVSFAIGPELRNERHLLLIQTGVAPDLAAGLAAGWHGFLDGLQAHLAGTPRTSQDPSLLAHYKQVFAAFQHS